MTKTPRKHAALIKAWADGAEIETRYDETFGWTPALPPYWHYDKQYRIKPTSFTRCIRVAAGNEPDGIYIIYKDNNNNLELTFDSEGVLIEAKVL